MVFVQVGEAVRVSKGWRPHFEYGVKVSGDADFQVTRRYTQFIRLKERCEKVLPGVSLPVLPGKEGWMIGVFCGTRDTVFDLRRERFQLFLNKAINHPELRLEIERFIGTDIVIEEGIGTCDESAPLPAYESEQTTEDSTTKVECETQIISAETETGECETQSESSAVVSKISKTFPQRKTVVRFLLFIFASCAYSLKPATVFQFVRIIRSVTQR